MRGSNAGNSGWLCASHILPAFWEQCSKYLWTICIPPDTIFVTLVGDMGSVEDGACLNALGAWGRDQFESSEVAQSTQLVAGGNRCLCGRVGWRRRDLRIVGSCRRY